MVSFSSLLFWSSWAFHALVSATTSTSVFVSDYVGSPAYADGVGTYSKFNFPTGIVISSDGSFALVADCNLNLIRRVTISTNAVRTLAGTLNEGSTNGVGTNSLFSSPSGISISPDSTYALVADSNNHLIRHIVLSTAAVTTFVGGASSGSSNGVGTNSNFNRPNGVSIRPDGVYALVTDGDNNLIRQIVLSTGSVTTLAGAGSTSGWSNGVGTSSRFNTPYGIIFSPNGVFALVADSGNNLIRYIDFTTRAVTTLSGTRPTGSSNGVGTNYQNPCGISISSDGTFALVADTSNHQIRRLVISTATVSTLAGSAEGYANGAGTNSKFSNPYGVSIAPNGLYALVVDSSNFMIRSIVLSTGAVTLYAGNGGSDGSLNDVGTNSKFFDPYSIALSPNNAYALVADTDNHLIRLVTTSTLSVTTFAGVAATSGSTNGVGTNSLFNSPSGVDISSDGVFALVADTSGHLIRQIVIPTSRVTTLAGAASSSGDQNGFGTSAKFNLPLAVVISPDRSYALVADSSNNLIRQIIITTSEVKTLAGASPAAGGIVNGIGTHAKFKSPSSISISPNGVFALVADRSNNRIRHIEISTATVTTLVGGPTWTAANGIGSDARFNIPSGVIISPSGAYALVADRGNDQIRMIIISTAEVTSVAGVATTAGSTNGAGTNARFNDPSGIIMSNDASYALIVDSSNNMIRKVVGFSPEATIVPSVVPSVLPTLFPSPAPSVVPTLSPSMTPTCFPTAVPSITPSDAPTHSPTGDPTSLPTLIPTVEPTFQPSMLPSVDPTFSPTFEPTFAPTVSPSVDPTFLPSVSPSSDPTFAPSVTPSFEPSVSPTFTPTTEPSVAPTFMPSTSPTYCPTFMPVLAKVPTMAPTIRSPRAPTKAPTVSPTSTPSISFRPTETFPPSSFPTYVPSPSPSSVPTLVPSVLPSVRPTLSPSVSPSSEPSSAPTVEPSSSPTFAPTSSPTAPTLAPVPKTPTSRPSPLPTTKPSANPTASPTPKPSVSPTKGAGGGLRLDYSASPTLDIRTQNPAISLMLNKYQVPTVSALESPAQPVASTSTPKLFSTLSPVQGPSPASTLPVASSNLQPTQKPALSFNEDSPTRFRKARM